MKGYTAIVDTSKTDWQQFTGKCMGATAQEAVPACGQGWDDAAPHPDKYSVECLQQAWFLTGCSESGSHYPSHQDVNGAWWHKQTVRGLLQDMNNMKKSGGNYCT